MPLPYYPEQETLPDGFSQGAFGENGSWAWRIEARGATPQCLFYAYPLIQTTNISAEISLVYQNKLNATPNGYEGIGVQARLMRLNYSTKNLDVIWTNNLIVSGDPELWDAENRGDEWVRRTWIAQLPDGLAGDFLDICVITKAPTGHIVLSNRECRNYYARSYILNSPDAGSSGSNVVREDTPVTVRRRRIFGGYKTTTYLKSRGLWYLQTIPLLIRDGERVEITPTGVVQGFIDSGTITIGAAVKLRRRSGEYDFIELFEFTRTPDNGNVAGQVPSHSGLRDITTPATTFTAQYEYTQAEMILYIRGQASYPIGLTMNHEGVAIEIITKGNEASG